MPTGMPGDSIKTNTARWAFGKIQNHMGNCRCIIMAIFSRAKREFGTGGEILWTLEHKHRKK